MLLLVNTSEDVVGVVGASMLVVSEERSLVDVELFVDGLVVDDERSDVDLDELLDGNSDEVIVVEDDG